MKQIKPNLTYDLHLPNTHPHPTTYNLLSPEMSLL